MKQLIKIIIPILALIETATANSTAYYPSGGMDYYWVPSNLLLFHVNYPFDFLIYIFAIFGFVMAVLKGYFWIKDWWEEHMAG